MSPGRTRSDVVAREFFRGLVIEKASQDLRRLRRNRRRWKILWVLRAGAPWADVPDRETVCLAAELPETGRALRTICREFSPDALPWLLHYSAEAFVRWLLAIFAPCRKQACSRSDIDVCDEQSFLAVRLTGKECAVGSHNR